MDDIARLATHHACQAHVLHQAGYRAAGDRKILAVQLMPDFANTLDFEVIIPEPLDFRPKDSIALGLCRGPGGIVLNCRI